MPATTAPAAPPRTMQGIAIPAESVNPPLFFQLTRRHTRTEKVIPFAWQLQDTVELLKADILAGIDIVFSGVLTTVKGAGTVNPSGRWPYDLLKRVVLSANGQSNLINVSGAKLKARDIMKHSDLTDRGVSQVIGAGAKTQGTLAMASEAWGVGSQVANAADVAAVPVELAWNVPVAEDEVDLLGALFLATSSSDLTLTLQYATLAELFGPTGGAAVTLTGTFTVISRKFSVPIGPSGQIVVPDLSTFHSMIESRYTALGTGENEVRLVGQGAGKNLLRVIGQTWNGATPAPVALTAANYGQMAWRYGSNETPDAWPDGTAFRKDMERRYNSDLGAYFGFWAHDFAHENVFRDVVDEGTAAELRLIVTLANGLVLNSPALEYVAETVFLSGVGA